MPNRHKIDYNLREIWELGVLLVHHRGNDRLFNKQNCKNGQNSWEKTGPKLIPQSNLKISHCKRDLKVKEKL